LALEVPQVVLVLVRLVVEVEQRELALRLLLAVGRQHVVLPDVARRTDAFAGVVAEVGGRVLDAVGRLGDKIEGAGQRLGRDAHHALADALAEAHDALLLGALDGLREHPRGPVPESLAKIADT
jgi:hypothetical protein